jgi:flagellin
MAQVINTNVSALFSGAALNKSNNNLQTAQARLSSGLRINSSKDDATGLTIATGIDSQIRGTNQAIRNANDGISAAQTADGLLGQVLENLQRLREIAVQNGGTIPAAASSTATESDALLLENTRLLGLPGLTDAPAGTSIVVDSNASANYTTIGSIPAIAALAGGTVADIDTDITAVSSSRAGYGADMVSLSSAIANMQITSVNLSAAFSRIMDTDYASESAAMTRNNILQQAGTAVLAQANQTPNSVLGLLR